MAYRTSLPLHPTEFGNGDKKPKRRTTKSGKTITKGKETRKTAGIDEFGRAVTGKSVVKQRTVYNKEGKAIKTRRKQVDTPTDKSDGFRQLKVKSSMAKDDTLKRKSKYKYKGVGMEKVKVKTAKGARSFAKNDQDNKRYKRKVRAIGGKTIYKKKNN
tara:strand:+ start:3249 stop:3722 length:474 start_codon:yes stop_codon:yes gene_type:complete